MSNKNIFDDLEFNNLELCFNSNNSLEFCFDNNDDSDFFDEILDNYGQLIINNEEDDSLSDCEVNDLTDKKEGLYPLNKGQSFMDWNEVESTHSHPMIENVQMAAPQYRRIIPEMQDDIELLAASNVHTGAIINAEKGKLSDAEAAYKELIQKKQEEPGAKFEGNDNHLSGLNSPDGMFSEDLYDKMLIKLAELLHDTNYANVKELWIISYIDQQKFHYIVLLDNAVHLCTCLTLVNRGAQKKVLKEATNVQHNQRTSSFNMNNELVNSDDANEQRVNIMDENFTKAND
ncbi:7017_t:CDS:2, partial [Dentiscutata heterogama]